MNSRFKLLLIAIAAVVGVVVTASLGQWQLSRAAQKEALQSAMDRQSGGALVDASTLVQAVNMTQLVYQSASLQGVWLATRTIYLDNRQMNARVGFFAVTPLQLEGGAVILVQRGWVPRNFEKRADVPKIDTPSGLVRVEGRIVPPPSKLYEPGAASTGVIRQNIDVAQLATETGLHLLPVTLQQTGPASEGLLREWPAINLGVDKHYGYAFQWFGLSALIAALFLWFQLVRRIVFRSKDPFPHVK